MKCFINWLPLLVKYWTNIIQKYFVLLMDSAESTCWFWLNFGKDQLRSQQIFCRNRGSVTGGYTPHLDFRNPSPILVLTYAEQGFEPGSPLAVSIMPVIAVLPLLSGQHLLSFTLPQSKGRTMTTYTGKTLPEPAMRSHRPHMPAH